MIKSGESWRDVFVNGFAPLMSDKELIALRDALIKDDNRLVQGATTSPPPLHCVLDWPVEAACGIGFCGWQGKGLETVGEVEEYFAKICFEADKLLQEPSACRWFLNWFDDSPREEVKRRLIPIINEVLNKRFKENPGWEYLNAE